MRTAYFVDLSRSLSHRAGVLRSRTRHLGVVAVLASLALLLMAVDRPPWHPRRRPGLRRNRIAQLRVRIADWPEEPPSPSSVEAPRFTRALEGICGWMPPHRAERYAGWILRSAQEFSIDPFLLAALAYREGRCDPGSENRDGHTGQGLTLIHRPMYADFLRGGTYRYRIRREGRWESRQLAMGRFPFAGPRLARAEENLYFAAGLLAVWKDQHPTIDESFEQAPHRHYVSHFIWGDRVSTHRDEDDILTDRRRLLEYYGARPPVPTITWSGVTFGCPLDGCPRVISSFLGSERDEGARSHRGVDLESLPGEPVHAVADGLVTFAGVDMPGHQSHRQIRDAAGYDAVPRSALGAGGRYACVSHRGGEGQPTVRSCYMHMETVEVAYGQRVRRGERIGTVGRTGMQQSAAHLHLELHTEHMEDPSQILYGLLLGRHEGDPLPRAQP